MNLTPEEIDAKAAESFAKLWQAEQHSRTLSAVRAHRYGFRDGVQAMAAEVERLQRELDHLDRKVQHGCADAGCAECDHA